MANVERQSEIRPAVTSITTIGCAPAFFNSCNLLLSEEVTLHELDRNGRAQMQSDGYILFTQFKMFSIL